MHALHKLLIFQVLTYLGQNADGSKIINGSIASDDKYEFLVSLQKNEKHLCGGFLISEDFVLTAAHCSTNEPDRVVVGTHNLLNVGEENVRYIEERHKHKSYYQVNRGYDIMLLKLKKKVAGNKKKIIAIPSSNMHSIQENKICHVAGWGFTETGGGVVYRLMEVDVSVINLKTCSKLWGGIPSDVICTGGNGHKGFCQGDSGGPLVCDGIAVGVVSFNYRGNCDYPNKPNVYTEISKYLVWINNIIN